MDKCPSCNQKIVPGSLFCDFCGATVQQVNVARKLRQASFATVTDSKGGLLNPGERISGRRKYLIEESIAKSGFGATFRALRLNDDKQVLIKQMLEQSSYDQFKTQLMNSFKREAKFLKRIKHPAFPRGYEYFVRNKSFYLVMDFINGKELAKALEEYRRTNGKVEDGLVVYLGIEIADALEVIHAHGYIYRDLKPQNVMLDGISSRVKLIDFGTLYHPSDSDPLIFESEGYTPPEFLDKSKKFLPSGDVYSLGALLYEAAVGETPEKGDTRALDDGKRDPRLCAIIRKCLEPEPSMRYQRARHVRDELSKLTRKGLWPFRKKNVIAPIELSVLPKTLYPSTCTFCEYCGYADSKSQAGYCKKCRVPLRVGRLVIGEGQKDQKEFFLYADETILGSSNQCHFPLDTKLADGIKPQHLRIFRINTGLWVESIPKDGQSTSVNHRKIIGPVELMDGDSIEVANLSLKFNIKDAC